MSSKDKKNLAKLYVKRAQCYMQMAEKFKKLRYANMSTDDLNFILNETNLSKVKELFMSDLSLLHKKIEEFLNRQRENKRDRNDPSHGNTNGV